MSVSAIWMLLTGPASDGAAVPLTVEIGQGTHGIGLRRVDMPGASTDVVASAERGATLAAEILYREQYLHHHLVLRYAAETDLFNVHGRSADLAFALTLAKTVRTAQSPDDEAPPVMAATGVLDENGRVQKVEGFAAKLALALTRLPPRGLFVFPADNKDDLPADAEAMASSRGVVLAPVAHLEDAMRRLGYAVFRRDPQEFHLWQDLSREAGQWFRGERAPIPPGPQLEAARALYDRNASDWSAGDQQVGSYIRASLKQRDRRHLLAGLAAGIPAVALAGFGVREVYAYVDSLHRTRITFADVSVSAPDYRVAAGPALRRFGVSILAREPDSSALLIVSNVGLYRGQAVDAITAQNFLTQMAASAAAPISYTLGFARPVRAARLLRAPLWAATKSGVTHPAWRATALDAAGKKLAETGEALLGSYTTVPEKWFDLTPKDGRMIAALRVTSDFRDEKGKPFAGFEAALIQEIQLIHS